ncbi:and other transporter-domain-containing protein [Clohesyomyces aquaticus]|uniref:And other transporter-domain-containing protein n=1 Tax=Clohesyomyces aquaticus TaxID=1231657 RepID=A0A1Y1Z897_9PLEO|nr:and other transporter-domain-containing protein [Clohesyomyces aquaticus]
MEESQSQKPKRYIIPRPRNAYNFAVALFVAFGSLSYGYASSISAAFIGIPEWYAYMGLIEGSSYSNSIIGVINCIYSIGGVFGCIYNMWAAEYFGRKRSIQMGCLMAIVGATIMTASVNIPMFVVSRLVMGFAIGILVTLVPLYQARKPQSPIPPDSSRFPMAMLLSQGREDEAWKTIKRLHANKKDPEDTYAKAEFRQMKAQIWFEREHDAAGFLAQARLAFSRRSFRKRLALGFLVQAGNQFTGALVVNNYQTTFYNGLGITGRLPLLLVGRFNFVTVPGNLANGLLGDYIGRRKFVITGCACLCVVLSVGAALTARFAETRTTNKVGLGFRVAFIFLFPVFYPVCLDATMYLIPAEIFPMIIRSFGISFNIMGQWVTTIILLGAAPTAFEKIGHNFWTTKGKTLEEISIIFGDPVGLTEVGHFATEELKEKQEQGAVEYATSKKGGES